MGIKRKPSHQNSLTQRCYQSTRKKRKVESKTFNKPSASELSIYQENLVKVEEVGGVCIKQEDDDTQENICCNRCHMWIHNKCTNVDEEMPNDYQYIYMYANSAIIFKAYIIMLEIFFKLINQYFC